MEVNYFLFFIALSIIVFAMKNQSKKNIIWLAEYLTIFCEWIKWEEGAVFFAWITVKSFYYHPEWFDTSKNDPFYIEFANEYEEEDWGNV